MQNELYHYGVIGMKWGRRRYQDRYGGLNKAGKVKTKELSAEYKKLSSINTLTKKGIKRLSDVEKEYEHLTGKSIGSHENPKVGIKPPKRLDDMTNEELTAYNTRKQLETTYLGYQPKPRVSKGKQFASFMGKKIILPTAIAAGQAYAAKLTGDKILGKATADAAKSASADAKKAAQKAAQKALKDATK